MSDARELTDERRLRLEKWRREAGRSLLCFMQYCWQLPPTKPFKIGRHTRALCKRLDRAVEDFMRGKSTFLNTNMPFRHGKSEMVSRYFPAYFLGRCASYQPDVILSGYGTSLVKGFSKKVQAIINSEAYKQVFPGVEVDPIRRAAEEWCIKDSQGVVTAQGLGGSITGKGGNLIIIDDYCKNREEAESTVIREKMWASFKDDLMTRTNAPAAIVIVCATRWHIDDIVGRIYEEMKKDPDYPRFESLIFPARKGGEDGWDVLFPEQYSADWYARQRASLGSYSAAALLDCDPVGDAMRTFKDEWLCFYDSPPPRSRMNVYIFVDSANSKKENADFTTMWVLGYCADGNYYALDLVHDRLSLSERTRELFDLVRFWKPNNVFWEQIGAMSDVAHIQDVMNREGWHFGITALNHRIAKETRIRSLQPQFEAHRIWLPRYLRKTAVDGHVYFPITEFVENEYKIFPGCRHDDMIDPLADINDKEVIAATTFPQETFGGESPDRWSRHREGRANTDWKPF